MTVAVLIVNWNGGDLLRRCLQSLSAQRRPADAIVVVDNASTDDSLALAARELSGVTLIRLESNTGFAAANNAGARAVPHCDLLALLNPDATAAPDWLEILVDAAERQPSFAAFACQMRLATLPTHLDGAGDRYHVSGRAWRIGHRRPAESLPAADAEVFGPCGGAAMYRREAFDAAGGFDDRFFCYFEDIDLAFRMRLLGYRCLYLHRAVVMHVGSALTGYQGDFAVYYGERNAIWTFVKNMPGALLWRYLPQHILLNLAALAYYPLRGQGRVVLKAKRDAIRGLPIVLALRRQVQQSRRASAGELRQAFSRGWLTPYFRRYS